MKRRVRTFCMFAGFAASISLAFCGTGRTDVPDDSPASVPWRTEGGSYARSGRSACLGPKAGAIEWTFRTDGVIGGNVVTDAGGRIFVTSDKGLVCLDPNGFLLWMYECEAKLTSSPSLSPASGVYVGDEQGVLHAVAGNGACLWTYATGGPIHGAPAVSQDGGVYVASEDGSLYTLDASGNERWRFRTSGPGSLPGAILTAPTMGPEGTLYIGGLYDPNLYALDAETGQVNWVCDSDSPPPDAGAPSSTGPVRSARSITLSSATAEPSPRRRRTLASPVFHEDLGVIYQIFLYDPNLYAIDAGTGTVRWRINLADPEIVGDGDSQGGWYEPAIGPDGTVYASLRDRWIRAVEPNGAIKWVAELPDAEGFHLTVDGNGYLYAGGDSGHLYVLTPEGLPIACMECKGPLGYPVIARDHRLLITYNEGYEVEPDPQKEHFLLALTDEDIVLQWMGKLGAIPPPPTANTEEATTGPTPRPHR